MAPRKVGKILLYCGRSSRIFLLLILAVKLALDRRARYQAEIKQWVHDRSHQSPCACIARVSLYGPETVFRPAGSCARRTAKSSARAAGSASGRTCRTRQIGKLFAGRIELDRRTFRSRGPGAGHVSLLPRSTAGTLPIRRSPSMTSRGTLAIRRGRPSPSRTGMRIARLEAGRQMICAPATGRDAGHCRGLPPVLGGDRQRERHVPRFRVLNYVDGTLRGSRNLSLSGCGNSAAIPDEAGRRYGRIRSRGVSGLRAVIRVAGEHAHGPVDCSANTTRTSRAAM